MAMPGDSAQPVSVPGRFETESIRVAGYFLLSFRVVSCPGNVSVTALVAVSDGCCAAAIAVNREKNNIERRNRFTLCCKSIELPFTLNHGLKNNSRMPVCSLSTGFSS